MQHGHGADCGGLTMFLDPSGCSSFRGALRYKLQNVAPPTVLNLSYLGTNGWVTIRNLARDQYYPTNQAWSYIEHQNVWLYFTDVRHNVGADARFFTNGFALKVDTGAFRLHKHQRSNGRGELPPPRPVSLPLQPGSEDRMNPGGTGSGDACGMHVGRM